MPPIRIDEKARKAQRKEVTQRVGNTLRAGNDPLQVLEKIYGDFLNKSNLNPKEPPMYSLAGSVSHFGDILDGRIDTWMQARRHDRNDVYYLLSVLSYSPTFVRHFKSPTHASSRLWNSLVPLLVANEDSLTFYARACRIPWLENFRKGSETIKSWPAIPKGSNWPPNVPLPRQGLSDEVFAGRHSTPDTFYLDSKGIFHRNTFITSKGTAMTMREISECQYTVSRFCSKGKPSTWPKDWPWPQHPQTPCWHDGDWMLCQGGCGADYAYTEPCTCTHDFSKPQIQIVEYNAYQAGKLNRGVRALQAFEKKAVIGEYVGKLVPPQMVDEEELADKDYILDMEVFVDGQTGHTPVIAGISAAREGNWTRFINHREKNWNVEFENMVTKDKHRICIRVVKDVKFGEQIFTNYGRKYFKLARKQAEDILPPYY